VVTGQSTNKTPWRLIVVVAFALLLIGQGYLSFAIRPEPYPSIRMPSFGPAAKDDGTVGVTFAHVEAIGSNGSVRQIPVVELMDDFRFSTARPSFDYIFRDSEPSRIPPSVKSWLRERLDKIDSGIDATAVRICWQVSRVRISDSSVASEQPCTWKTVVL
jgi:hypothetical protein